jgi:hypothetical protein
MDITDGSFNCPDVAIYLGGAGGSSERCFTNCYSESTQRVLVERGSHLTSPTKLIGGQWLVQGHPSGEIVRVDGLGPFVCETNFDFFEGLPTHMVLAGGDSAGREQCVEIRGRLGGVPVRAGRTAYCQSLRGPWVFTGAETVGVKLGGGDDSLTERVCTLTRNHLSYAAGYTLPDLGGGQYWVRAWVVGKAIDGPSWAANRAYAVGAVARRVSAIPSFTVTNATNATPVVVTTSAAHGFANGEYVLITGVAGNIAANGTFVVKNVTGTTFELTLTDSEGTDVAGVAAYIAGGSVQSCKRYRYLASAITTGLSAAAEPTWPRTVGSTVVDGGVTWTCIEDLGAWGEPDELCCKITSRIPVTGTVQVTTDTTPMGWNVDKRLGFARTQLSKDTNGFCEYDTLGGSGVEPRGMHIRYCTLSHNTTSDTDIVQNSFEARYGSRVKGGHDVRCITGLTSKRTCVPARNFWAEVGHVGGGGTSFTWDGSTAAPDTFVKEQDASYSIVASVVGYSGGTPAAGYDQVASMSKTTTGVTITTAADPGAGVTVVWHLELRR